MNIRKPGQNQVSFGTCKDNKSLLAYALTEGYFVARAMCKCSCQWVMIIAPDKFKRLPKVGETHSLIEQPCLECGRKGIHVRILHAPFPINPKWSE